MGLHLKQKLSEMGALENQGRLNGKGQLISVPRRIRAYISLRSRDH